MANAIAMIGPIRHLDPESAFNISLSEGPSETNKALQSFRLSPESEQHPTSRATVGFVEFPLLDALIGAINDGPRWWRLVEDNDHEVCTTNFRSAVLGQALPQTNTDAPIRLVARRLAVVWSGRTAMDPVLPWRELEAAATVL
jgi:hypothetical protein